MRACLYLLLLGLALSSCFIGIPSADEGTFQCKSDDDCADGYECEKPPDQRWGECRDDGDPSDHPDK